MSALAELRRRIRALERTSLSGKANSDKALTFGVAEIDDVLPWGGLAYRGLHEIAGVEGDGSVFGFAAALLGRVEGFVLWCRHRRSRQEAGMPYGPGLAELGLAPDRLILVETGRPKEVLWAMEEGLRCSPLAAVLCEGVTPDLAASRRLQLAAEAGGTIAFVLGPAKSRSPTSVALTRWRVTALPSIPEAKGPGRPCWRAELLRCRGGAVGEWRLEWDDEALRFAVAAAVSERLLAAATG